MSEPGSFLYLPNAAGPGSGDLLLEREREREGLVAARERELEKPRGTNLTNRIVAQLARQPATGFFESPKRGHGCQLGLDSLGIILPIGYVCVCT